MMLIDIFFHTVILPLHRCFSYASVLSFVARKLLHLG